MLVVTSPAGTIPMALAEKVRSCGGHLEDAQWRAMPPAARQRLLDMPVTNAVERRTFANVLLWLTDTFRSA